MKALEASKKSNNNSKVSQLTRNKLHKPYESCTKEVTLRKSWICNKNKPNKEQEKLNKSLMQRKYVLDNSSIDCKDRCEIASVKNLNAKLLWNNKVVKTTEQEIAETLKKALIGKNIDKKFEMVSKLFNKLITIDIRYGCILKEIKSVYDERIEILTAKSKDQELKTPTRNIKNHTSMKLAKDSSFSKKTPSITSPVNTTAAYNKLHKSTKSTNKKTIIIPKLDLTKVKRDIENDGVVYKKVGKQSELISLNSYSEDYEKNPIVKYNMKVYGTKNNKN